MKTLIKLEFDKLVYDEYYSSQKKKYHFNFAYPLFDFINANIKERFNSIDINNIDELNALFEKDDMFITKLFYLDDLTVAEKGKRIRKILSEIETKQKLFSTIINFCFLLNADVNNYSRQLDKLIFICNKLNYKIQQPKYCYSITYDDISVSNTLKLDDIDETTLQKLDTEYLKLKQGNRATVNYLENVVYECESIDEFFFIEMLKIFERNYKVLVCKNCGKLFVPSKKNDAIYCDRQSPQNANMTCKKYANQNPKDETSLLYRKIYMKKSVRAKRHKDDFTITNEFEKWKSKVDELRAKYSAGTISSAEFEKWLLDNDK
ncbi:MAG: DUF6076 domain-containing protein [Clostridia bacterium]|nr:DUF6076 domain-containing protein [Clostridia bacterium]